MTEYTLSIGSNVDEAASRVTDAIKYLFTILSDCRASSVYSTPSICNDNTTYSNAVVRGCFPGSEAELNSICKDYENCCGRIHEKGAPVIIDIDVVTADDRILRQRDYSRNYFTTGVKELS